MTHNTTNHEIEYSSTSAHGCHARVLRGVSRLVPFCDECDVEMSLIELGRKREYLGYECPDCGRVMSLDAWSELLLSVNNNVSGQTTNHEKCWKCTEPTCGTVWVREDFFDDERLWCPFCDAPVKQVNRNDI